MTGCGALGPHGRDARDTGETTVGGLVQGCVCKMVGEYTHPTGLSNWREWFVAIAGGLRGWTKHVRTVSEPGSNRVLDRSREGPEEHEGRRVNGAAWIRSQAVSKFAWSRRRPVFRPELKPGAFDVSIASEAWLHHTLHPRSAAPLERHASGWARPGGG